MQDSLQTGLLQLALHVCNDKDLRRISMCFICVAFGNILNSWQREEVKGFEEYRQSFVWVKAVAVLMKHSLDHPDDSYWVGTIFF